MRGPWMSPTGRDTEKAPDDVLVARAANGDRDAFRELFERYRQRAYRVAWRYLGRHEDAMDAVQDSFIKAWRALSGFEGRAMFRTWLMRIVTNTCLDRRRGRGLRSAAPLTDEESMYLTEFPRSCSYGGAAQDTGNGNPNNPGGTYTWVVGLNGKVYGAYTDATTGDWYSGFSGNYP